MSKKKKQYNFASMGLVVFIWNKRRILTIVGILAFVVSIIISLNITPMFKSTVVLFPTASASVSGTLLTENMFSKNELLKIGGEEEGEQLMQVLQSEEIKSRIIRKYNLVKHYGLDSTSRFFRTKLNNAIADNIKIHKTEYMSVVIDVYDQQPDTAAFIANDIASLVDTMMNKMIHERAEKALLIVKNEYNQMTSHMAVLEDSMKKIRELGVLDYETQSQVLSAAYAQALEQGNTKAAEQINRKLQVLAKYGGAYVSLRDFLTKETDRLSLINSKYQQAQVDANQNLPYKYIVDKAYASERKAYPKRSIIVIVSTVATLFLAVMLLLIFDSIASAKKED